MAGIAKLTGQYLATMPTIQPYGAGVPAPAPGGLFGRLPSPGGHRVIGPGAVVTPGTGTPGGHRVIGPGAVINGPVSGPQPPTQSTNAGPIEADAGTGALLPSPTNVQAYASAANALTANEQGVIASLMQSGASGGQNQPLGPQLDYAPVPSTTTTSSGGSKALFIIGILVVGAIAAYVYYRKHHHAAAA